VQTSYKSLQPRSRRRYPSRSRHHDHCQLRRRCSRKRDGAAVALRTLYSKGIRYLKFPNDSGGYNIIDWKTGDKSSVDEWAHHF
jgi:hypothetical protein